MFKILYYSVGLKPKEKYQFEQKLLMLVKSAWIMPSNQKEAPSD